MQVQFATDGVPAYRRLALWQDIVCDVYVQLDCKSVLGSAFNGRITRAPRRSTAPMALRPDRWRSAEPRGDLRRTR